MEKNSIREKIYIAIEDKAFDMVEDGYRLDGPTLILMKDIMHKIKIDEEISLENQMFVLSLGISLII